VGAFLRARAQPEILHGRSSGTPAQGICSSPCLGLP
jgi:hypothetical protein